MPERTLASEPVQGWHAQGKPHSPAALEWMTETPIMTFNTLATEVNT